MTQRVKRFCIALVAAILVANSVQPCFAHFPWLATDDEGRALLFFGESPADRTYHVPEAVAAAKVVARTGKDKLAELKLENIEEDDFIGRRSGEPVAKDAVLEATVEYGLYHSMLLTYYAKHLPGDAAAGEKAGDSKALKLEVIPQASEVEEGVTLLVTWEGKPLADAGVTLSDAAGETHEAKTNEQGQATFEKVSAGLVGVIANRVEDVKGEINGEKYNSAAHYATLTFQHGSKDAAAAATSNAATGLPALPEPLASFGGAVADGYLYVYSGHIGGEHEHSKDNLSQHFRRVALGGGEWEELPMQMPLQGLPLVAHDGKLYRVGGLSARNAEGEDEDLHSVDEFACFDPATKEWTALPSLPEPRSSHDAVVIGDVLYVVGGWTLSGSSKGKWVDTAWAFDLTQPNGGWRAIPSPSFRRRALAAAQWQGKLVALGGMTEDHDISRRVNILDLERGEWSKLAKLPGEGMDGFGVSAWNLDGKLYASGTQESLYRLADDGQKWEAVLKLNPPRFFHRLLPGTDGTLLVVGGASEEGHLATIEELSPTRRPSLE
jgi:hypothetical protein